MAQFAGYHGDALNQQYTSWQELICEGFHTLAQIPGVSVRQWLEKPSRDVEGSAPGSRRQAKRLVEMLHTSGPEREKLSPTPAHSCDVREQVGSDASLFVSVRVARLRCLTAR